MDDLTILNSRLAHAEDINEVIRLAFGMTPDEPCEDCIGRAALAQQLGRFPEGQFVALLDGKVVGTAHTMRLAEAPHAGNWMDTIGTIGIANHIANGEWLYGVEMAVHPGYRRRGIGTALYQARFELCKRLNLRGWYAGGMLMGYHQYADALTPLEYGEQVLRGEIEDPTVTMQMNRGFRSVEVIEDYLDEPLAGNAAVLIVWQNPQYKDNL